MNITFLIAAIAIAIAAAAPLMITLLGRGQRSIEDTDAMRARAALAAARAADVINQDEYEAKLAALPPMVASAPMAPVSARLAIVIAIALPAGALALYAKYGEPRAIDPAQATVAATTSADGQQAPDLASALAGLESRLEANPNDAEGWALLARGYQSSQQFDKALAAMKHVRELLPDDLDAQVGYAEALGLASPDRSLEGEPLTLIESALTRDPVHQRALWLAGIAEMQRGDSASALKHWRTLENLLPPGSDIRTTLAAQIRSAESEAGLTSTPAADADPTAQASAIAGQSSSTTATPAAAPAGHAITVSVRLDPALAAKVSPTDTLFVFARAASGPRMPLAIQRLTAADLPATVQLDDSTSMMPTMTLSTFPDIVIGARISKTGNAIASSGDLQVLTETISQSAIKDHVQLTISDIVP